MIFLENLYNILGIDKTAGHREIKKAYAASLRRYPPEKAPEEAQKINEAYEILMDSNKKYLYDIFLQYEENKMKLEKTVKDGDNALGKQNYKGAIRNYRSALIMNKDLIDVRNKLALVLFQDKQYREAIVEFEIIIRDEPANPTHYSNLARVYRELEDTNLSEKYYFTAYTLDLKNSSLVFELTKFYVEKKEYEKAEAFLRKCIEFPAVKKFQDTLFYLELLSIYLYTGNMSMFEKTLDDIEFIMPNTKKGTNHVALEFAKLSAQLFDAGAFQLSEDIGRRAYEINSNNKYIENIYNKSRDINIAFNLFERLKKDKMVIDLLKKPLDYHFKAFTKGKNKDTSGLDQDLKDIVNYIKFESWSILKSMERLRKEYEILYNREKLIYDNIYELAKEKN